MPDTCWSIQQTQLWRRGGPCPQGGHCLGRRKNAYHKISAMGEEDTLLTVQKWREGWELAFKRPIDTAYVEKRNYV